MCTVDLGEARRLFNLGFKLCKLLPKSKRPEGIGWNLQQASTFDERSTGYGIMLASNDLCSVDPDNAEFARRMLAVFGFNLEDLLNAGVRSVSTRPDSGGRAMFRTAAGLRWRKFSFKGVGTVLELRAHSANLQDVIPGLVYSDKSGELRTQRYLNCKRIDDAPELPADFLAWWERLSSDLEFLRDQQRRAGDALGLAPQLAISGGGDGKSLAFKSAMRESFNAVNTVAEILLRHGYEQSTEGRFSPPTATGKPGVRPIPGRDDLWQSDHASDPLFGTFDAWTAYVVLDHDGDQAAAETAAVPVRNQRITAEFDYCEDVSDLLGEDPVPIALPLPHFTREGDSGKIKATKANTIVACGRPDLCRQQLRYDSFRDEIMLATPGSDDWRAFKDTDYTALCLVLEKGDQGFKNIPKELIRDAVAYSAEQHTFDSARHWLDLQRWDGKPRVERFLIDCFGAEDTAYVRAVARYFWTALAGRVLKPGIKADMVPVAVGKQGAMKSSAVAAIVPAPDFFMELDIGAKDDDLARLMRGKLVIELGELRGLRAKEVEHVKAFITRTHEKWIPKWKEMSTSYARRCLFFGTTNKSEFLADDTGHRRWLPFTVVSNCNPDGVVRDRGQLWAEARELFKANGIEWQAAERLAIGEHDKFVVRDPWEEIIERWLTTPCDMTGAVPGDAPFTAVQALREGVNMVERDIRQADKDRMSRVLRELGWSPSKKRVNGKQARIYERAE